LDIAPFQFENKQFAPQQLQDNSMTAFLRKVIIIAGCKSHE
jgi:hypothetical protein